MKNENIAIEDLPYVNRVEIIEPGNRAYVGTNLKNVQFSFQDENSTLKIFVNSSIDITDKVM